MTIPQHRHSIILTVVILFAFANKTFSQRITINSSVDTTDQDIKAVTTLWTNYLKSNPNKNNIKDSPFWADTEKKKFPKVDQLLNAINSDYPTYSM